VISELPFYLTKVIFKTYFIIDDVLLDLGAVWTVASTSQSTRRPNPEEHHQYRHRRENLKSHTFHYVCLEL
jgi:hypothetical protein